MNRIKQFTFALVTCSFLVSGMGCLETTAPPPDPVVPHDSNSSAPLNLRVLSVDHASKTLTLTWDRPISGGKFDRMSLGYAVYTPYLGGDGCATFDTICVLTSIKYLVPVKFTVYPFGVPWDQQSLGVISDTLFYTAMPLLPSPPVVQASSAIQSVTLTFGEGVNVGYPNTGYMVTVASRSDTCIRDTLPWACTFSGLHQDSTYRFDVRAKNPTGYGLPTVLNAAPASPWTTANSGVTANLNAVASNGSLLVAVGDSGTIVTSLNGESWSIRSSTTRRTLRGIVWASSRWIAVGDTGTILTSNDGVTWTMNQVPTSATLRAVAHGDGITMVGGDVILFKSSSADQWEKVPLCQAVGDTTTSTFCPLIHAMIWSGQRFYTGEGPSRSVRSTSQGLDWVFEYSEGGDPMVSQNKISGFVTVGSRVIAVGGNGGTYGGRPGHVYPPERPGAVVFTSADGAQWSKPYSDYIAPFNTVAYDGKRLLAAGSPIFSLLSLDSGVSWSKISLPSSANGSTGHDSKIVVVGNQGAISILN